MNTLPTAEEFFTSQLVQSSIDENGNYSLYDIRNAMTEFAKLHVEQALKAASDCTLEYDFEEEITNSYPLTNIK